LEDERVNTSRIGATRLGQLWRVLTPKEWGRLGGMATVIVAMHVVAWGIFLVEILPRHFHYTGLGIGVGVAVTAYTLGARHAFDADHISAIDNVTRKLMSDGKRPLGTGFFFSLGHSTVIMVVGVGISLAARAVFGAVVDPHSTFASIGGVVGTAVSGSFLYLIAALNIVVLAGIVRVYRDMRQGVYDEAELERQLQSRGLMYRFFGRFMRAISATWQMYPVGVVFAVGFDTATEILLLSATAAAATEGLPWFAVICLPLLFSSGVTLFDTLDGCFMNFAYGWAFSKPVRKVYYNLVITGLSVTVAFAIGTIELVGLLATELHLNGGFWGFMADFDINRAGFVIVGLFVLVWTAALVYWRMGQVEARWAVAVADADHVDGPSPLTEPETSRIVADPR
jgi:high-affinity nickel-transport protein